METRCMAACVGKIRLQGLNRIGEDGLWAEDRWHPLYYAIRVEQVALPLYPQWGTEPNGYYIPPRHSPRSEEHTSELQSRVDLVCRLLLEKKKLGGGCVTGEINHTDSLLRAVYDRSEYKHIHG